MVSLCITSTCACPANVLYTGTHSKRHTLFNPVHNTWSQFNMTLLCVCAHAPLVWRNPEGIFIYNKIFITVWGYWNIPYRPQRKNEPWQQKIIITNYQSQISITLVTGHTNTVPHKKQSFRHAVSTVHTQTSRNRSGWLRGDHREFMGPFVCPTMSSGQRYDKATSIHRSIVHYYEPWLKMVHYCVQGNGVHLRLNPCLPWAVLETFIPMEGVSGIGKYLRAAYSTYAHTVTHTLTPTHTHSFAHACTHAHRLVMLTLKWVCMSVSSRPPPARRKTKHTYSSLGPNPKQIRKWILIGIFFSSSRRKPQ